MATLAKGWIIERPQDAQAAYGADIERELAEMLQYEIAVELKLVDGWRKVQVNIPDSEVEPWIRANFRGQFMGKDGNWIIETADDYTAFVLRFNE